MGGLLQHQAAFAAEFLGGGDSPTLEPSVTVGSAIAKGNARQIVGNIITNYHDVSPSDRLHKVEEWLAPSQDARKLQHDLHAEAHKNQEPGTGRWFIEGHEFVEWLERSEQRLWVQGSVGCGKTVLFTMAVEAVRSLRRQNKSHGLAFFYCTSRDTSGQDITTLLRQLLVQLCRPSAVPGPIQELYNDCNEEFPPRIPRFDELLKTLLRVLKDPRRVSGGQDTPGSRTFLLVDGLDEFPYGHRDPLFKALREIAGLKLHHLHILVTSRDQTDIRKALGAWPRVVVDAKMVQADIRLFVDGSLNSEFCRLSELPEEVKDAIRVRVVDQGKDMFLLAFHQMKALKDLNPPTKQTVLTELKSLPHDIDETYCRILKRVDKRHAPKAVRALTWLVFSSRRLFLEELIDACAIDVTNVTNKDSSILDTESRLKPYEMLEMLHDLITIEPAIDSDAPFLGPGRHSVLLSHTSVAEFLKGLKDPSLDPPVDLKLMKFALQEESAHVTMAQACLAYLFWFNTYERRHDDFPLRQYAWYNWDSHVVVPPLSCIETLPTYVLRRTAIRIYNILPGVFEEAGELPVGADKPSAAQIQAYSDALRQATSWLPVGKANELAMALNIPFFYPNFDEFCPGKSLLEFKGPAGTNPFHPDSNTADSGLETVPPNFTGLMDINRDKQKALYSHRPLANTQSIRLLEILPALSATTVVMCRLTETPVESAPPFAALSYSWGVPSVPEVVLVEGLQFHVRPNQAELLRALRLRAENSTHNAVWLDVFCINMVDQQDMSQQFRLVTDVFSRAREVIIGVDSQNVDEDERGIALLSDIATSVTELGPQGGRGSTGKLRTVIQAIDESNSWHYLLNLFTDSWWSRSWVIQEVTLPRNAVVLMRRRFFNFSLVERLVLAEALLTTVLEELGSNALETFRTDVGWKHAKSLVYARNEYRIKGSLSLPDLIWRFRHAECADPRDKIFSLIGMCNSLKASTEADSFGVPVADYAHDMHARTVFARATRWIIDRYQTLDSLSVRSAFQLDIHAPSWCIPRHCLSPTPRVPLVLGVFDNRDSRDLYSAGGKDTSPQKDHQVTEKEHILPLHGYQFDVIDNIFRFEPIFRVHPQSSLYNVTVSSYQGLRSARTANRIWRTMSKIQGGCESCDPAIAREVRWRVMLADQYPTGQRLARSSHHGVKLPPDTTQDEELLIYSNGPTTTDQDIPSLDFPMLEGRQLMLTAHDRWGLAPEDAENGDILVVMPGGAVPYVLRKRQVGGVENLYQFMGECYVHGCMDGEIPRSLGEDTEWWSQSFDLF
ncbi:heterokaryon incompatibility protein-domain-containing protein [Podospora conica]|nr:heterokaryon incompatibility protein-domain-containing protein [Schizothecium conicum]